MKLTYLGNTYDCITAEKKVNEIVIRTGKYENGEEIIYHVFGDIDFDAVTLDGGGWSNENPTPTPEERIAELEEALALLLSGDTE